MPSDRVSKISSIDPPMYPARGRSELGAATSALIPQTMVVSPKRTSAEPFAVDIDPARENQLVCHKHGAAPCTIELPVPLRTHRR